MEMLYNVKRLQIENYMESKVSKSLLALAVVPVQPDAAVSNGPVSYIIGGIVALLIMGYLVYTLLRPEKF